MVNKENLKRTAGKPVIKLRAFKCSKRDNASAVEHSDANQSTSKRSGLSFYFQEGPLETNFGVEDFCLIFSKNRGQRCGAFSLNELDLRNNDLTPTRDGEGLPGYELLHATTNCPEFFELNELNNPTAEQEERLEKVRAKLVSLASLAADSVIVYPDQLPSMTE
jgi:hypothetical protein